MNEKGIIIADNANISINVNGLPFLAYKILFSRLPGFPASGEALSPYPAPDYLKIFSPFYAQI
jgi:hypothetical protein